MVYSIVKYNWGELEQGEVEHGVKMKIVQLHPTVKNGMVPKNY
jgi:hypothetical protein